MPLGAGCNVMPLWQNNILLAHLQPWLSRLKISTAGKKKSSFHTLLLQTTQANIISVSE